MASGRADPQRQRDDACHIYAVAAGAVVKALRSAASRPQPPCRRPFPSEV